MPTPDPIIAAIRRLVTDVPPLETPLSAHFQRRTLARGAHWLHAGTTCRKLAFVLSGSLRLYVVSGEEAQTRWAFFADQFCTALQSFQQQTPAEESIVALERTELLEIDRDAWWALHAAHPFLQRYWQANMDRLAACYEDRVNSLLLPSALERYRYTLERYPDFVLRLPQKYVAEMLNMAPRHLSRVRRELAAEGGDTAL